MLYPACFTVESDEYTFTYYPGSYVIERVATDDRFIYPDIQLSDFEFYETPLLDIDEFVSVVKQFLDDYAK